MKKEKKIPRTALVACSRLVDFAGAEIASLEIAQALSNLGVEVELAALEIGFPFEEEIKSSGIKYIDLSKLSMKERSFDLIWVSHYIVAYHLLVNEKVVAKTGVYSSLSHFEPLEAPPLPSIFFSRYIVNSEENYNYFKSSYPDLENRLSIFPNSAPIIFLDAYRKSIDKKIKSVAVISNHAPSEICELVDILRADGIDVDLIGVQGKKLRVTPDFLSRYSAVISIGKTIQYCLATGTPAFCYDHFGGPGWITHESIDEASKKNFSGRCSAIRRTSKELLSEFILGFNIALKQRETLRNFASDYFNLEKNIIKVLDISYDSELVVALSETDAAVLSRESEMFLNLRMVISNCHNNIFNGNEKIYNFIENEIEFDKKISDLADVLVEREDMISVLSDKIVEREDMISVLSDKIVERERLISRLSQSVVDGDEKVSAIYQSNSWRITSPLRWLSKKLSSIFHVLSVKISFFRFLIKRSLQVIRYQGLSVFLKKSIIYLGGIWRQKIALLKFRNNFNLARLKSMDLDNKNPMISFIIPIYDRTDVLRIAIQSALNQSYLNIEIILVTDGSPIETLNVINEFSGDSRVRIFNFPTSSGNAVRGRNKGILEASGEYIAFLDSDDVATPDRIKLSLPLLQSGETDVVYGAWRVLLDGTREIDGLTNGQVIYSPDCDLEILKKICVPCQSTIIVRKDILYRTGFLKPKMKYREDHELWIRIAYFGGIFKSIADPLVDLRLHAGNNELNFKTDDFHWESLVAEEYMTPALVPKKIAFIIAGIGISGGLVVILKHANFLMSIGHDVLIINVGESGAPHWAGSNSVPIIDINDKRNYIFEKIDILFATFWTTCDWLKKITSKRKLYFIQSDERLFYDDPALKACVASTYSSPYEVVAIAGWICDFLSKEFSKKSYLVPNGIDLEIFHPSVPMVPKGKRLRVLIEGPIVIPFKGVADAYAAIESLDCEIWIVSSAGKPDPSWRVDRFFESVAFNDMPKLYSSCDILLKMSRIESFSYPPLEAMACGCAVVACKVFGSIEYIGNDINALIVEQGDIDGARKAVKFLLEDSVLRERLINEGYKTVKNWSWDHSFGAMLKVVDEFPSEDVQ
jgi:glycosyltransferase involved in cell wall biosynthesis